MSEREALHLFDATGVELEYMIVDQDTLDVRPIADRLLEAAAGEVTSDVERGTIAWSNELTRHVIELKLNGPAPALGGVAAHMQENVAEIGALLAPMGCRLLPTAMHPWMDPDRELQLWPHDYSPVYRTFDRLFDCRGHGWANLQSTHINLPFHGDAEFGRLHAAIRLVLPILPALAASSPVMDGKLSGMLDTRLWVYGQNSRRIPSILGKIVPERVFTRAAYEGELLGRIYRDLAPLDPEGVLRHSWVNARGAIARFDRGAIEIRVLDIQEAPVMDLAVVALVVAVVRALVDERWIPYAEQTDWHEDALAALFHAAVRDADEVTLDDTAYLRGFGVRAHRLRAHELWQRLAAELLTESSDAEHRAPLDVIFRHGCLARRIVRALGSDARPAALRVVYGELAECLAAGRPFAP